MEKLKEIQQHYLNSDLSAEKALKQVFDIYLVSAYELELHKLEIEHIDYGLYRLRQDGDYLMESDQSGCLERAWEIRNGINTYKR